MVLDKWYLDAVFPDGTVWYGYRASLRLWKGPHLFWAAGCEVLPDGRQQKASRWKQMAEPRLENGQWQWRGPDGFAARWEPLGPGMESELGSDDQFQVCWNCVVPKASVTRLERSPVWRDSGQDSASSGLGYIEHLRIESAATQIPFRDLWWGRAHAGPFSLVWIRWGSGREFSLVVEDGVGVNARMETQRDGGVCIQTPLGVWETGCGRALCDRDVRRSFPRLLVWLTGGMAPLRELKMSGPVRLRTTSSECSGSGIWEEVKWQ